MILNDSINESTTVPCTSSVAIHCELELQNEEEHFPLPIEVDLERILTELSSNENRSNGYRLLCEYTAHVSGNCAPFQQLTGRIWKRLEDVYIPDASFVDCDINVDCDIYYSQLICRELGATTTAGPRNDSNSLPVPVGVRVPADDRQATAMRTQDEPNLTDPDNKLFLLDQEEGHLNQISNRSRHYKMIMWSAMVR